GALADLPSAVQVDVGVHVPELAMPQALLDEIVVDGDLVAPRAFQIVKHEAHRPVDDEVADVAGPNETLGDGEEPPADAKRDAREREQRRCTGVHAAGLIDRRWIGLAEAPHAPDG